MVAHNPHLDPLLPRLARDDGKVAINREHHQTLETGFKLLKPCDKRIVGIPVGIIDHSAVTLQERNATLRIESIRPKRCLVTITRGDMAPGALDPQGAEPAVDDGAVAAEMHVVDIPEDESVDGRPPFWMVLVPDALYCFTF